IRLDGEHTAAAPVHRLDGAATDSRHVEAHVLLRLGDLHDDEAAGAAELAGALDGAVGALDRLDREHRPLLHRDALADVQLTHLLGQLPAECNVGLFLGGRTALGQAAGRPAQAPAAAPRGTADQTVTGEVDD